MVVDVVVMAVKGCSWKLEQLFLVIALSLTSLIAIALMME